MKKAMEALSDRMASQGYDRTAVALEHALIMIVCEINKLKAKDKKIFTTIEKLGDKIKELGDAIEEIGF